ncbi:MAG: MCE family protein [Epsilonproteobacteria bacterium]|nr:MCE family protein [Campylobacterota bacterium]
MYSRINYTIVGFFVVLFAIGSVYFAFWLAKGDFNKEYDYYKIYFSESVNGLNIDSDVKLNGVSVGKVLDISIDKKEFNKIVVKIGVRKGTPITTDMRAVLKFQGVTGLSYIDIEGGKSRVLLKSISKSKVPVIKSKLSIGARLTQDIPRLLEKSENIINSLATLLSSKNISTIEDTLNNIDSFTKKLQDFDRWLKELKIKFSSLIKEGNNTLSSIEKLSNNSNDLVLSLKRDIPKILKRGNSAIKNFNIVLKSLNRSIKKSNRNLNITLRAVKIDLDELSARYKELADDLRDLLSNPSKLLLEREKLPKGPGE